MWAFLDNIADAVTRYTTCLGKIWYVLVFVFRLSVVASLGGAVYQDEQSNFQCSTDDGNGCKSQCYNEFAMISHIRFWGFQLLAVVSPTICFHFFCLYVTNQYQKVKQTEKELNKLQEGDTQIKVTRREFRKLRQRRRNLGKVKERKIIVGSKEESVPITRKIEMAYFITLLIRIAFELIGIYVGFTVFNIQDGVNNTRAGLGTFLWMVVPGLFYCDNMNNKELLIACYNHYNDRTNKFSVPCWVSRPTEKTILLRYMNILSFICVLISVLELVVLIYTYVQRCRSKEQRRLQYEVDAQLLGQCYDNQTLNEVVVEEEENSSTNQQATVATNQQATTATEAGMEPSTSTQVTISESQI